MNGFGRSEKEKNKQSIFTEETLGVVMILFATLALVCLITGDSVFYKPGQWISEFLFGLFGYFAYLVDLYLIVKGIMLIAERKLNLSKKIKVLFLVGILLLAALLQIISLNAEGMTYGEYLSASYTSAYGGIKTSTAGGLIISLVAYWIAYILSNVGGYVVLSACLVLDIYAIVREIKNDFSSSDRQYRSSYVKEEKKDFGVKIEGEREYPVSGVVEAPVASNQSSQKLFVNNPKDFAVKTKREVSKGNEATIKLGFTEGKFSYVPSKDSYSKNISEELKKKIEYIKKPAPLDLQSNLYNKSEPVNRGGTTVSDYISKKEEVKSVNIPMIEHDEGKTVKSAKDHAESFMDKYASFSEDLSTPSHEESAEIFRPLPIMGKDDDEREEIAVQPVNEEFDEKEVEKPSIPPMIEEDEKTVEETEIEDIPIVPTTNMRDRRVRDIFGTENKESISPAFTSRVEADKNSVVENFDKEIAEEKPVKPTMPINMVYNRPPIDLLERRTVDINAPSEDHEGRQQIIKQTLEDFHINAEPQSYIQGPTVTRYEIMMPAGISVKKVLNYDDDLKMRLSSRDGIRIEAPIPGKNLVGIEVANKNKVTVGLREVLEGMNGANFKPGSLVFALGKDIVGNSMSDNLAKGPHYLVAGATGSGKSVCLNVMLISLIMRYSPEELRLVLIDPKGVEFRPYEHIPHLMIDEIVTEPKKALAVLQWAYDEMERRYKMFMESGGLGRDIDSYNQNIAGKDIPKMPRVVIVVDELSNLMETCKKDMEAKILAIAQKARSAGIHLVLATQRPSVDVITGTIKANLPSRIALKVTNFADSNTILGEGGAEKLLGNGDMLYKNSVMPEYERYQGAWISDREIDNVVTYIKEHNTAYFDDEMQAFLDNSVKPKPEEDFSDTADNEEEGEINEFFLKALWHAVNSGQVSISQLQRRFQIGYARAGGLVDKMERMGFVSGNEGSKARRVLISREEFEEKFGPMSDSF